MSVWGDPAFKFSGTEGRQYKYLFCFCLSGADTWYDWYPFKVLFMLCHSHPLPPFIFPVYRSWFLSRAISCSFLNFFLWKLLFMSWFVAMFFLVISHWSSPAIRFYPNTWIKYKELLQSHCYCTTFSLLFTIIFSYLSRIRMVEFCQVCLV